MTRCERPEVQPQVRVDENRPPPTTNAAAPALAGCRSNTIDIGSTMRKTRRRSSSQ
jgi:hypothetical protein